MYCISESETVLHVLPETNESFWESELKVLLWWIGHTHKQTHTREMSVAKAICENSKNFDDATEIEKNCLNSY